MSFWKVLLSTTIIGGILSFWCNYQIRCWFYRGPLETNEKWFMAGATVAMTLGLVLVTSLIYVSIVWFKNEDKSEVESTQKSSSTS